MRAERLESMARKGKKRFLGNKVITVASLDTVFLHRCRSYSQWHMGIFLFRPRLRLPLLILGVLNGEAGERFDSSPGKFFSSFRFSRLLFEAFVNIKKNEKNIASKVESNHSDSHRLRV